MITNLVNVFLQPHQAPDATLTRKSYYRRENLNRAMPL